MPKQRDKGPIGTSKALIENDKRENPFSYQELAEITGASLASIYRTAARLRKEGRIKPSIRQPGKGRTRAEAEVGELPDVDPGFLTKPPNKWDARDLASIDSLPVLSPDQRRKLLSAIGMRPSQGTSQVAALGKLEDLDNSARGTVGPPEPLTDDERVVRLSRLMKAVGQRIVNIALEAAFGTTNQQDTQAAGEA